MHLVPGRSITRRETLPRRQMVRIGFDPMLLQTPECGRELTRLTVPIAAPPSGFEEADVAGLERAELDGSGEARRA